MNLTERLRAGGNAKVDADLAFEAAAEIERCWAAIERDGHTIRAAKESETELQARCNREIAARDAAIAARVATIAARDAAIAARVAELARLKADNAAVQQAEMRGFRQGFHAAATKFSHLMFDLTRITVPIGAHDHSHKDHHHG